MEIQEAIHELWRRSGKNKEEYAAEISFHETHIKNVLNGKHPGSPKILKACLEHAGYKMSDAITLPPDKSTQRESDEALAIIKRALLGSGGNRERVLELAETLRGRMGVRRAANDSISPVKVKRPANTGHG